MIVEGRSGRKGRVTSYDVAREAEVSQSSVCRAFDPESRMSQEMRTHIRETAHRLGWRPNAIARSLQRRTANFIGLITSELGSGWRGMQLASLLPALQAAQYRPLVFQTADERDTDQLVGEVMAYQGSAVILGAGLMTSRLARICVRHGLLVISLNRWIEGPGVISIACDHALGARLAVRHLVETGSRRLLFLQGRSDSYAGHERQQGFVEEAARLQVEARSIELGNFTREAGVEAGRWIGNLPAEARPDGVFAVNDELALGVLEYGMTSKAYEVPRDFGLVGFDGTTEASRAAYSLTTVAQPLADITAAVVDGLENWDRRKHRRPVKGDGARFAPSLIIRKSTKPNQGRGDQLHG